MLLPFSRRVLSVAEIASRYVPTVIGDICKENDGFRGYILLHQPESSSVLLLDANKVVAGAFYSPEGGLALNTCNCRPIQENMSETLAVEVMECEETVYSVDRLLLSFPPSAVFTARAGIGSVSRIMPADGAVLLTRFNGAMAEMSLWDDGRFLSAWCFDKEQRSYVNCDEKNWEMRNCEDASFWMTRSGVAGINPPDMGEFHDPLMLVVEKYFVVLNNMQEIMDNLYGANTLQDLNALLERYKQKYPPLYRGLYINPETHKINWERIIDNRSRVDVKFRYDRFPLYLDEVLLDFVKLLYEKTRVEGIRQLRDLIIRLKEFSPDRDSETSDRFFKKLEKVLRV